MPRPVQAPSTATAIDRLALSVETPREADASLILPVPCPPFDYGD